MVSIRIGPAEVPGHNFGLLQETKAKRIRFFNLPPLYLSVPGAKQASDGMKPCREQIQKQTTLFLENREPVSAHCCILRFSMQGYLHRCVGSKPNRTEIQAVP